MVSLCNELAKVIGKKVNYAGKDGPTLEQFPGLIEPVQLAVSSRRYKKGKFLLGALDEENPNKDKYKCEPRVWKGDGTPLFSIKLCYGFQRFVLEARGEECFLQKIPLSHGVTSMYGDSGNAFLGIMSKGFRGADPVDLGSIIGLLYPDSGLGSDAYSNAFLGYPFTRLKSGAFNDRTELEPIKGDSYEIIFLETNEPLREKHKEVVPLHKASDLLFVSFAFSTDMIGVVHLSKTTTRKRDRKISAYLQKLPRNNLVFMQDEKVIKKSLDNILPQYRDIVRYIGFEKD